MTRLVVTDTTCLIALDKLGRLDILPALFEVHAPEAVADEFGQQPHWLTVTAVDEAEVLALRSLQALDLGEAEAIVLAQTFPDACLLLDDARGRAAAHALGFRITGKGGVRGEGRGPDPARSPAPRRVADGPRLSPWRPGLRGAHPARRGILTLP